MTQLQQDLRRIRGMYESDNWITKTLDNAVIKLNILEQMTVDKEELEAGAIELSSLVEKIIDYEDLKDAIDEDQESMYRGEEG